MALSTVAQESLDRARGSNSTANFAAIFDGFTAKGIPAGDITPRVNVFTLHAWNALGRRVRRGEHGVQVVTWIVMSKQVDADRSETFRRPKTTTVFHISQTDPIQ